MIRRVMSALVVAAATASALSAQGVPTPRQHFGFDIGEDRKLANWDQLTAYYEKIAASSPRVTLDTLGLTTMGRPFVMMTVTSPENHARLDEIHEIQMKLADPRTVSGPAELERLLDEGRTVAMITHAIHATEVGSGQTAARLAWRLASSNDPEILRILDEVVLLHIPSLNPDGLQWVADWYNEHVGTEYEAAPLPWLYQFYVGHDNNRDWYAYTQNETIHTVMAQNRWHPQIVHDIHQMGGTGARIFFPPYIDPWEPNIDPALTTAVNQLGMYMAAEVTGSGKAGVVVNGQYDAFTPARAYMHYHGGARILSETASAAMATPVEISWDQLNQPRRGFHSGQRSWNFPNPWTGGRWGLPNIVDYMESGALALLKNAARNRRFWLENFHGVTRRAVAGWESWPDAWVIPSGQENGTGVAYALRSLTMGDVEVHQAQTAFIADGIRFPAGSWVIPMNQPWAGFAQTLLEVQVYPDLRQYPGGPPLAPYDVTGHTLGYLMDFEAVSVDRLPEVTLSAPIDVPEFDFRAPAHLTGSGASRVAVYKPPQESMEAGWTRWLLDAHEIAYDTLGNADIQGGGLADRYDVILFQSQSPRSIESGYDAGSVPEPYVGGLGATGAAALRAFVNAGGRIVAIEEAVEYAADLFDLGVENRVDGLPSTEFYVPGSILRLELDSASELTRGMDAEGTGWFWRSSMAFDVDDDRVRTAVRYGTGDPLLSGWVMGGQHVAGRPAVLEASIGQGSVVLFGFQPNYRSQTVATWPLLFNALSR